MKKAWIENNKVRDIANGNPNELFHPDIASHYNTDIPDDIVAGAELVDGTWINPSVQNEETVTALEPIQVSPIEFKMLFTVSERLAINTLKETDDIAKDWFSILDDPRLTHVDLSLGSTVDGVTYLVSKEILTEERKTQILSNTKI